MRKREEAEETPPIGSTEVVENSGKTSVRLIAKRLGLSAATVSLALNGRRPTGFVSASTRKQVWMAAEEMGYSLDRLRARRPLLERTAVFMKVGPNPVYSETVLHLCRALTQRNVQVLTHLMRSDQEIYAAARELFRRHEIDAAVFIGSRQEMPSLDLPCVFIGEVPTGIPVWQVRADNEGGGRSVGEYLWSLGHRSVATILPDQGFLAGERRLQGLRAYWKEQGRDLSTRKILRVDITAEAPLRALVTEFLQQDRQTAEPATAFFCFNDWVAGMLLKVLRSLGVRVPEEMSVVGFDDSIYAGLLDPPLTTVHNPFNELGSLGAELLLEQVEAPDAQPRVLVAHCSLIVRQSCMPPGVPPDSLNGNAQTEPPNGAFLTPG